MFKEFLKKDNSHKIYNRIKRFNKDFKNLNIKTKEIKEMIISFESNKYEKIYDSNNIFIKTKPIKYNILYEYIKHIWRKIISHTRKILFNIRNWFY